MSIRGSGRTIVGPMLTVGLVVFVPACARVAVDPIEVKPIHIVHDINIRVDRELEDFFAFEDQMREERAATQAANQPTTAPATQPVMEPVEPASPVHVEPVPQAGE